MIWSLLIGLLPKVVLNALDNWNQRRLAENISAEKTWRTVMAVAIESEKSRRKEEEETRRHAMNFRVFWVPWFIAATPWSIWVGFGFLDSIEMLKDPTFFWWTLNFEVHELPPQLAASADAISVSIFGSGSVGLGVQAVAKALAGRKQ